MGEGIEVDVVAVVVGVVNSLFLASHIIHAVGSVNGIPVSVCVMPPPRSTLTPGRSTPAVALSPMSIAASGTMWVRFGKTVDRKPSMVVDPLTGSHCALTLSIWETVRPTCGRLINIPAPSTPWSSRISTPTRSWATRPSPRVKVKSGDDAVRGSAFI